jgi:hypothetical protein
MVREFRGKTRSHANPCALALRVLGPLASRGAGDRLAPCTFLACTAPLPRIGHPRTPCDIKGEARLKRVWDERLLWHTACVTDREQSAHTYTMPLPPLPSLVGEFSGGVSANTSSSSATASSDFGGGASAPRGADADRPVSAGWALRDLAALAAAVSSSSPLLTQQTSNAAAAHMASASGLGWLALPLQQPPTGLTSGGGGGGSHSASDSASAAIQRSNQFHASQGGPPPSTFFSEHQDLATQAQHHRHPVGGHVGGLTGQPPGVATSLYGGQTHPSSGPKMMSFIPGLGHHNLVYQHTGGGGGGGAAAPGLINSISPYSFQQ